MKILIPVKENKGLQSEVHSHFGSAPMFILVDDTSNAVELIDNSGKVHTPGACNPFKALGGRAVDAVIVVGIVAGALMGFRRAWIRVFHAEGGTVMDTLSLLAAGRLPELDQQASCAGHDAAGGGGCHQS